MINTLSACHVAVHVYLSLYQTDKHKSITMKDDCTINTFSPCKISRAHTPSIQQVCPNFKGERQGAIAKSSPK